MKVMKCKIVEVTDGQVQKIIDALGGPGDEINERSYFQHTGFSSIPRADDIGIALVYGNSITFIGSADNKDDRPELNNEGDMCIYSDENKYIKVLASGDIEVSNGNASIELNAAGDIEASNGNGNLKINTNGTIELGSGAALRKLFNENFRAFYDAHIHGDPVTGSTSPPLSPILDSHLTENTEAT